MAMRMDVPEAIYVKTKKEAKQWARYYRSKKIVGFDTETTGIDTYNDRVKFFSFADKETRIAAPVYLLQYFKKVLEDPKIAKCMSNCKFDIHMSANHKIKIEGFLWDTVTMSRIQNSERYVHGLKATAKEVSNIKMNSFKDVFGGKVSIEESVRLMCQMYRAMHITENEEDCMELLMLAGSIVEPRKLFLKDFNKLVEFRDMPDRSTLSYKKVLDIARRHGYADKTAGQAGYVKDWANLIGIVSDEYDDYKLRKRDMYLLEDNDLKEAAIYICIENMLMEVDVEDPMFEIEDRVCEYASLDAWASFQLVHDFKAIMRETIDPISKRPLLDYYTTYCSDFLKSLWEMERNGVCVNIKQIQKVRTTLEADVAKAERKIIKIVRKKKGAEYAAKFNPKSSAQLVNYFFTNEGTEEDPKWYGPFGRPARKLTASGNPSTAEEVLKRFAEKGDNLALALADYKKKNKVISTYLKPIMEKANRDGRIRTNLIDFGAVTGRIASREPNLMNIPKKGEAGKMMRKMFEAAPGYKLIVADYSALEMRLMAHFSGDKRMIKAILDGLDPHCYTAALAQNYDYDEMLAAKKAENPTKHQLSLLVVREQMKAVGYGLLYGIGEVKLGQGLGLPIVTEQGRNGKTYQKCPEAAALMATYFRIYPGVLKYIQKTHAFAKKHLMVRTFAGRHIQKQDIVSGKGWLVAAAKRQAQNGVIQGTAADIVNAAMIKCFNSKVFKKYGVKMLLQVHDELILEVPDDEESVAEAMIELKLCMENPYKLKVPITIDMDCADNWGDAK